MDCFCYFFTNTVQSTDQPSVCPQNHSGAQEPCQPVDALPLPLLFHIFCKGKLGWGVDCILGTCSTVAWVTPLQGGPQITPPPWHKDRCTAQCLAMGGATAKSCLPFFRGRDPDSTRSIGMFYSFQLSCQSTEITHCSPKPIQLPNNPVSLLTIYPGSYCTFLSR